MEWVLAIIKLVILFWSTWRERDRQRKENKRAAAKMLKEAIKKRDPQKRLSAYDRARRA